MSISPNIETLNQLLAQLLRELSIVDGIVDDIHARVVADPLARRAEQPLSELESSLAQVFARAYEIDGALVPDPDEVPDDDDHQPQHSE